VCVCVVCVCVQVYVVYCLQNVRASLSVECIVYATWFGFCSTLLHATRRVLKDMSDLGKCVKEACVGVSSDFRLSLLRKCI